MNRRSSYNINVTEYKCLIRIKLNVGKKQDYISQVVVVEPGRPRVW